MISFLSYPENPTIMKLMTVDQSNNNLNDKVETTIIITTVAKDPGKRLQEKAADANGKTGRARTTRVQDNTR